MRRSILGLKQLTRCRQRRLTWVSWFSPLVEAISLAVGPDHHLHPEDDESHGIFIGTNPFLVGQSCLFALQPE